MKTFRNRGLILVISICLLAGLGITDQAGAGLPASEASLTLNGASYEINPDADGNLWVSDFGAGEIRKINPGSGAYEGYQVTGSPADARRAGDFLWWADGATNIIGQMNINTLAYSKWQIADANGFYSTAVDDLGRFYATDNSSAHLFQLDSLQPSNKLCDFNLPQSGAQGWFNAYMAFADGSLWVANTKGQLLRLQVSDDSASIWTLSSGGVERAPFGVTLDAQGSLWYADFANKVLARLNPTTNELTSFAIPIFAVNSPTMISFYSGFIWYTDDLPAFGRLDPLTASSTSISLTPEALTLTPSCSTVTASDTGTIQPSSGVLDWTSTTYRSLASFGGWRIFAMPAGAAPWGISAGANGFVLDSARNVVSRFSTTLSNDLYIYLLITTR